MNAVLPEIPEGHGDPGCVVAGFAALSHPARIKILRHLAAHECCCCGDVVEKLALAQSTVSQHLRVLVDAGLVIFEPDRRRSRYRVDRAALAAFSQSVDKLVKSCC